MRTAELPTGPELRRASVARGLTAAEVADACGLHPTTVWRIENGRPASVRVRRLVAVALGLPLIQSTEDEGQP